MDALEQLQALYKSYQEEFYRNEQTRRPGSGMLGIGTGPRNDPCHGQFAEELEALLQRIAGQKPGPAQARRLLDYIYRAPLDHPNGEDAVYWMLLAVHSLTFDLIPLLEPQDAQALLDGYQGAYPRRQRIAAQGRVLSALKARAKGK